MILKKKKYLWTLNDIVCYIFDFDCIKDFFVFIEKKCNLLCRRKPLNSKRQTCLCIAVGEMVGTLQLTDDNTLINVSVIKV